MVRKMAYVGSSYLIGLFFASFLNYKVDFIAAIGIAVIAISYFVLIDRKRLAITVCMLTAAAALAVYGIYEVKVYYPILQYDGQEVTIKGEIIDRRYYMKDKAGYIIKGKMDDKTGYFLLYCETLDCDYYDDISVTGIVDKLEDSYTFPSESYYKAQSIFLEMTVPSDYNIVSNFSYKRELLHYRDYLYGKILSILPNVEGNALVAMLCGEKIGLDSDTKTVLFRSGIGHIMSVSGVQLVLVTSLIIWFAKGVKLNKGIRFLLLEVLILGFTVFSGFSESVLRSAIMITIVYGAELFLRRNDNFNSLGIAIILLSFLEPFVVRNASFMLSVVGVFGIGVAAPMITSTIKMDGFKGKVIKNFVAMLCVSVTIFPVSFLFFDEISLISPITNVLLVPFCSVALVCGIFVAMTGGITFIAFPLLMVAGLCCKIVLVVSGFVGDLSFTYIPTGFMYIEICIVALIIAIILSYIIFKSKKVVIMMACTSIVVLAFCNISYRLVNTDVLSIAVLGDYDDSSLIIHKGEDACIIDLKGGSRNANANQKYLRRIGIKNVRVIALGSDTQQSISAYGKRFQLFDVGQVLLPSDEYFLDNTKILGVTPTEMNRDDTEIDMGSYQIFISTDNTIKVTYGDFSMLCASGLTEIDHSSETYSVAAFYEGTTIPVNCGYIISMNEYTMLLKLSNVMIGSTLVTCNEDGQTSVRGITNGSRQ